MSNARKISDLIVGTEVKVSGVDSDLSNKVADIKSRLDSDEGRLQSLDTSINNSISTIKGRLDSDDSKLQQLDTLIKSNLTNLADSDVIINQITAKVNSVISNLDSDTTAVQAINTQILGIKNRLDSDDAKLQSLDTTIVNIKSRLDSDDGQIQAVNVLATSALSASGMKDSDLKVVADLRSDIDSEIIYARNLTLSYTNYVYNATAGQTTFTGSDANSATLAYTAGSILVFLNGIKLEGEDYTATDGTSIVLAEAAAVNNQLVIVVPRIQSSYITSVDWSSHSLAQSLQHSGTQVQDQLFGEVISIDGNYAVVTARNLLYDSSKRGKAYIFFKSGGSWAQQAELSHTDTTTSNYGGDACISGDTVAVADSAGDGAVRIFTRSGTTWTLQQKITGNSTTMNGFGDGSMSLSGDVLVVGCHDTEVSSQSRAGRLAVFRRSGSTWSFEANLEASDPVANGILGYYNSNISGNYVISGVPAIPAAYIWYYNGSSWAQQVKLTSSDTTPNFGFSTAIDGDIVAVGAPGKNSNAGAAYIFTRSGTSWTETTIFGDGGSIPNDVGASDQFGYKIDVDGNSLAISASNRVSPAGAGSVYIFQTNDGGSSWTQEKKFTSPSGDITDSYGYGRRTVAIDESSETIIVGAYHDDTGQTQAGKIYIYEG